MAYTARDTPAIRARVERDLGVVLAEVRAADPALRALVLTGGFARGEGAFLDGAPQNDYDFVALRGLSLPRRSYASVRAALAARLGLHVDLAPVAALRLRWVQPSVFWYETALRGRTLWGPDLLGRIPVRDPGAIAGGEGLRLLANRAAGLLLATHEADPRALRLQAAKGLLAALDAHLLARGRFAPSQTERWRLLEELRRSGAAPPEVERRAAWMAWAFRSKLDPGAAPVADARAAWRAAADSILEAVPAALRRASLPSLDDAARRDGWLDHLYYYRNARGIPGAWRLALHPTGRVRVGTLRLLEASLDGSVRPAAARRCFGALAQGGQDPLRLLAALRGATLQ